MLTDRQEVETRLLIGIMTDPIKRINVKENLALVRKYSARILVPAVQDTPEPIDWKYTPELQAWVDGGRKFFGGEK